MASSNHDEVITWTIGGIVAHISLVENARVSLVENARVVSLEAERTGGNGKERSLSAIGCGWDYFRQEGRERAAPLPIGVCCGFTSARSGGSRSSRGAMGRLARRPFCPKG
jgi:hypothetical protein